MAGYLPSRRRFLGGAGVVVGLPFLESAAPRSAWGQPGAPIRRFLPVYFPVGVDKRGWGTGSSWVTAPTLAPLAKVSRKTGILDGVCNIPGFGLHELAVTAFLTCRRAGENKGGGDTSVDQLIAARTAAATRVPSLQVGVESGISYPGSYPVHLSWKTATQPLPLVGNPVQIFNSLFQGFDPGLSQVEAERRRRYETSVLDYVRAETQSLGARVGRSDRVRLDQYLSEVRQLESKLTAADFSRCSVPQAPAASTATLGYDRKLAVMIDLVVLAFRCDATRVILLASNTGNHSHPWLGIPEGHHDLSHWGADTSKRDRTQRIDVWQMQQYASLIEKLDAVDDGGGRTLLDNTFAFFSSEVEEGDSHGCYRLPLVVNGTLGGVFPAWNGRYIRLRGPGGSYPFNNAEKTVFGYGQDIPLSWLYVSVMNAFGLAAARFGDDTIQGDLLKTGQLG